MIHQLINSVGSHYDGTFYEGFSWDYHFHNSFELIYVLSGNITVFVNADEICVKEGEFFLISPSAAHAINSSADSRLFIAIFTQDFAAEFYNTEGKLNFYHFTVDEVLLNFFKKYMLYAKKHNRYMLKACSYALCAAATENNVNNYTYNTDYSFVFKVNKYISENFKLDISRKDLASALNYEEHYFSFLFSKNMNITLKKYINIYRFALSQKLLVSTNLSITQIASECGFKSIRSFNDVFKDLSGITPTEYRKKFI